MCEDYKVIAEILAYIRAVQELFGKGLESEGLRSGIDDILGEMTLGYDAEKFWREVTEQYLQYKSVL